MMDNEIITTSSKRPILLPVEPIAVDAEGAALMIGVSRSQFYKLLDAGKIGPMERRFGDKCVRFSLEQLRAWGAVGMPPRHEWQHHLDLQRRQLTG